MKGFIYPRNLLLITIVSIVLIQISGCFLIGGIVGANMRKPEMTDDKFPLRSGTIATFKLADGSKKRARLIRVEERSEEQYASIFRARSKQVSDLRRLPMLRENILVSLLNRKPDIKGRFNGFIGYGSIRLRLLEPNNLSSEWLLSDVVQTTDMQGRTMSSEHYRQLAKSKLLPSLTVFAVNGPRGDEIIPTDDILRITYPRYRRVLIGVLIGAGVDILAALLIIHILPDGPICCFD